MKIIYRSILKELILTFLISLSFLNFILMIEKVLRLSRFLSGIGIKMIDMGKIILYLQPQLLLLTIPMAFLLSTLLTYGRLSIDNEITMLKVNGMGFKEISKPVFILGIMCFLLNIAVSFYMVPKSTIRVRNEIVNTITTRLPLTIEEGTFNTSFKDIVIMIKEKPGMDMLRGIFIYDGRNKDKPRVLVAREGKVSIPGGLETTLQLNDGYVHIAKGNSTTELFFEKYNMLLRIEADLPSRKNAELTPLELIEEIHKSSHQSSHNALSLQLEFYRRLSLPLICIILIFLGPPLSLMAGKSGRLGGLALGLGVFTIYYILLIYGENLVRAGKLPHYLGAWMPTVVLGFFAALLFKMENSK